MSRVLHPSSASNKPVPPSLANILRPDSAPTPTRTAAAASPTVNVAAHRRRRDIQPQNYDPLGKVVNRSSSSSPSRMRSSPSARSSADSSTVSSMVDDYYRSKSAARPARASSPGSSSASSAAAAAAFAAGDYSLSNGHQALGDVTLSAAQLAAMRQTPELLAQMSNIAQDRNFPALMALLSRMNGPLDASSADVSASAAGSAAPPPASAGNVGLPSSSSFDIGALLSNSLSATPSATSLPQPQHAQPTSAASQRRPLFADSRSAGAADMPPGRSPMPATASYQAVSQQPPMMSGSQHIEVERVRLEYDRRVLQLEETVERQRDRIAELQRAVNDARSASTDHVDEERRSYAEKERNMQSKLSQASKLAKAKEEQLRKDMEGLKKQVATLQAESRKHQADKEKNNGAWKKRVEAVQKTLAKALSDQQIAQADAENARSDLRSLQREMHSLRQRHHDMITQMTSQLTSAENQRDELSTTISQLQRNVETLSQTLAVRDKEARETVEALRDELTRAREERQEIESQLLDSVAAEQAENQRMREEMQRRIANMEDEMHQIIQDRNEKERKINEQCQALIAERRDSEATSNRTIRELREEKDKIVKNWRDEHLSVLEEIENLQKDNEQLKTRLQQEQDTSREINVQAERTRDEAALQVRALQRELQTTQQVLDALRRDYEHQIAQLEAQTSRTMRELAQDYEGLRTAQDQSSNFVDSVHRHLSEFVETETGSTTMRSTTSQ